MFNTEPQKKILVAPLNWGLGHAARCIPIINFLIDHSFEPILASDGDALILLQREFLKERKTVKEIHSKENLSGIISDNRFGIIISGIPSVYITHQLNVLSGNTTAITSFFHQKLISKFDECWVPDTTLGQKLSGELSNNKNEKLRVKFIGAISRFKKDPLPKKYDLLIVLSGPEPQRTLLENKLITLLKQYTKPTLLVRGIIADNKILDINTNVSVVNYLLTEKLQEAINQSYVVLARSGYSTILDLATLGKKAFFIPTPGQYEQLYLADRMKRLKIAPFKDQNNFELEMLEDIENYYGFKSLGENNLDPDLLKLF